MSEIRSAVMNPLVADTGTPPIPEAQEWLARYDGSFGPPINLSQAVPGSAPHHEVLEKLAWVSASPEAAKYGPILGDHDLRAAYAADVSAAYGGAVAPANVAITAGCNMAFFAAIMAAAKCGDAVVLPAPWYFNHQMTLNMLGIEVRPLPCREEDAFVPQAEDAAPLLDGKVKAVVLVTPNNPTGAIYPPHVIEEFANLCRDRGIFLIIDETYRDFLSSEFNRAHHLFEEPELRDGVIQLYSFSKAYAIPGHRAGAVTASEQVINEIGKVLDCMQICAPRPAQMVLPWAIEHLQGWRDANRIEINRRASVFASAMRPCYDWTIESSGAYFAYLRHPFPDRTAREVAEGLATERGLLCLPGSYFGPGQENHLRVAFGNVGTDTLIGLKERFQGFFI
jgi:aspartate/methionine/tyrosine aminotransferase